jgi:2'-5' RNA ligase
MEQKRLFLALWPDDRQRNNLNEILPPLLHSIEGKMTDRGNWHVTLVFIGGFPEDTIPELLYKMARIEVQPFRLRFDRLTFMPRPKIACLEAMTIPDELIRLKQDLESMLLPYGVAPEKREYRPHITTMRQSRPFETIRPARPIEMQWSGFELVESVSIPGNVRYRVLKQ